MIEPLSIANELGGWYYFLFDAFLDDSSSLAANDYIEQWASEHGRTIKKSKTRDLRINGMFEVRACLV